MKRLKKHLLKIIIIFSLLLYVSFAFHNTLSPDEAYYSWQARQLLGEPTIFLENFNDYGVVVPIIIAVFDIFLPTEFAASLIGVLLGILGVYLIYLLGKELRNKNIGLVSALFLGINPWYWMLTCRILLDVPITVFVILNVLMLTKFYKTKKQKFLNYSILTFLIVLFTKSIGVLFLPLNLLIIFMSLYPFKKIKKTNFMISILFSIISILIIFFVYFQNIIYFFKRYINFGRIQENYLVINNLYNIMFGYIPNQLFILFYLLSIFFVGLLIYLFIKNKKQRWIYYILVFWIISVFSFRLFFGGYFIVRYVITSLPALILLIMIILNDSYQLINKKLKIKKLYLIIIIIILIIPFLLQGYQINKFTSYSKTGFKESGTWLKENVNVEDSIIYSGNPQQIRYYSGFEFFNKPYNISKADINEIIFMSHKSVSISKKPELLDKFNKKYLKNKSTTYLQIDFREKNQPSWVNPNITNAKIITDLGFEVVYVVKKKQPFYMAPPTADKNDFLNYFNITPYIVYEGKNKIFPPNIEAYSGINDGGEYLEEIGFKKADSLFDYIKFSLTFDDTYVEQPLVIIFKKISD
jgi:hypothetical protein